MNEKLAMMHEIQETSLRTERLDAYHDHVHYSSRSITLCDRMKMNIKSVIVASTLVLTLIGVYYVTVYSGGQRQSNQLSEPDQLLLQAIIKEMKQKSTEQISEGDNFHGRYRTDVDKYRGEDRDEPVYGRHGDFKMEWPKRDDMFDFVEDSGEKDTRVNNDLHGKYSDFYEKLKQVDYSKESDKGYRYPRKELSTQKDSTEYDDDIDYEDFEKPQDNNFLKEANHNLKSANFKDADEVFPVPDKEYHNIVVNIKTDTDVPAQNVKPTRFFSSTEIDKSKRQRQPVIKDSKVRTGYESNVVGEKLTRDEWFTAVAASTLLKEATIPRDDSFPYSSTPLLPTIEQIQQNEIVANSVPNRVITETYHVEQLTEPLNPEWVRKSEPEPSLWTPNIQTSKVESAYDKLKKNFEYHAALLEEKETNANTYIHSRMENDEYSNRTVQENNSKALHSFDWYTPGLDQSVSDCTVFQTISGVLNICVYPENQDRTMSTTLRRRHTWEFEVLRDVQLALLKNNTYNLIDLGSSLGMYSLAAASLNRKVVAVEPFISHVLIFQKSVMLNKFQSIITLLVNAISDKYEFVQAEHPPGDMTASTVIALDGDHFLQKDIDQMIVVNTITMNDLLNVSDFKSAILKMDIAGDEFKAMKHADKLFQTIHIPFIFMHWANVRNLVHAEDIISFLVVKGYEPRAGLDGKLLDIKNYKNWEGDIVWQLKSAS